MNIKCVIAYDGTDFCGYQRQKNLRTVQGELEQAAAKLFREPVTVYASGRTDSGVHARGQTINFRITQQIPVERIPFALNSLLPDDIVVKAAMIVPDNFHARIHAMGKTYAYYILNQSQPDPFLKRYCLHIPQPLDMERMQRGASHVVGTHDFSTFLATGSRVTDAVRRVTRSEMVQKEDMIAYQVSANGFLYNMVRIIIGTLIEMGRGKTDPDDMPRIIRAQNRDAAAETAPPHGLFLEKVMY